MTGSDKELTLKAKQRQMFGKQNKKLRAEGIMPAVLYGPKQESMPLEIAQKEFEQVYRKAGESTLVNLVIDDEKKPKKVLIHEVAQHFMKDLPIHVDLYEVDLTKKIRADVPLHFIGESPAVKELGGTLVRVHSEIEVEALPADLPHEIEADISMLKTFEDVIRLGELKVEGEVQILGNPEEVIASVQEPRSEEELAELEEAPVSEEEAVAAVAGEEKEEGEDAGEDEKEEEKPAEESEEKSE